MIAEAGVFGQLAQIRPEILHGVFHATLALFALEAALERGVGPAAHGLLELVLDGRVGIVFEGRDDLAQSRVVGDFLGVHALEEHVAGGRLERLGRVLLHDLAEARLSGQGGDVGLEAVEGGITGLLAQVAAEAFFDQIRRGALHVGGDVRIGVFRQFRQALAQSGVGLEVFSGDLGELGGLFGLVRRILGGPGHVVHLAGGGGLDLAVTGTLARELVGGALGFHRVLELLGLRGGGLGGLARFFGLAGGFGCLAGLFGLASGLGGGCRGGRAYGVGSTDVTHALSSSIPATQRPSFPALSCHMPRPVPNVRHLTKL
ncbi:hypothetical protein D3C72_1204120 [compost metagenome]